MGTVHSNRFILAHNFETSIGQYSGVDLMRMNTDIELRYKLKRAIYNYADQGGATGPNRMVAMLPEYDHTVAGDMCRRVIIPSPSTSLVSFTGATGAAGTGPYQFTCAAQPPTAAQAIAAMTTLAPVLSMLQMPIETIGYSGTAIIYNKATGTADTITTPIADDLAVVNLASYCKGPSYYEFIFYTHFDQIVIIETFGTVSVTSDIFNVI